MNTPFIRSPYNYDMDKFSQLTGLLCEDPSLAQDQFREETDINTIVRQFGLTGQLPENPQAPVYADFTEIFDFQTANNAVIAANKAFMEFPAQIRRRFQDDPQQMVAFLDDNNNRDEAVRLGLIKPPAPPPAPPAPPQTSAST